MSTQGVIAILLTVIGFLVVAWVGIASMWIKDRFKDHEERIVELENSNGQAHDDRQEILGLLRKQGGI